MNKQEFVDSLIRLNIKIPRPLHKKLKQEALDGDIPSLQQLIYLKLLKPFKK